MSEHLEIWGAIAVLAVLVTVLEAQLRRHARAILALSDGIERERKAAVSTAGHPSLVESTHESPRPTPSSGTPQPSPAPRLVSPTRAKLAMERRFSQKAAAAAVLRRAAEEQAR